MLSPVPLQKVLRTVTVSYPIPFLVAALLLFSILCFGGAVSANGALRWLLAAVAAISFLEVTFLVVYGTLFDTSLLRSEQHDQYIRALAMIGDSDVDRETRGRLAERLFPGESVFKRQVEEEEAGSFEAEGREEGDNG